MTVLSSSRLFSAVLAAGLSSAAFAQAPASAPPKTQKSAERESALRTATQSKAQPQQVMRLRLPVTANSAVTITVDASANRHAINPYVYGASYASTAAIKDLNMLLNRYGGNNTSRYNWKQNADNRASDYYFESIGDTSAQAGERGDTFFKNTRLGSPQAQAMLTVPMLDYVANLGPNRNKTASFSVAKYGQQTSTDYYFPDAGDGVLSATGANITGNNPLDANVASSSTFQQGWVQHLVSNFGLASAGGLKYYILDNEPSIWFGTHRDVHPTGPTMSEMSGRMIDYAGKIKATDPTALVVGPEEWGWSGYFYSGYDQQYGNANGYGYLPDRSNNGNIDYIPYLLKQLQQKQTTGGVRLLDVFSLHFYPQGGEFSNDTTSNTELLRNRSTRGLWDPNYVNESWIGTQVQLIPRMKSWVSSYYPGTLTGITEYSWGADAYMNGATTQADILGIFGVQAIDMAARWTCPDPSTPTYQAFKIYRNYDGNNGGFGDTSVSTVAPSPDDVSAFSAVRSSDGALTTMVVDKDLTAGSTINLTISNFSGATKAHVWQIGSAGTITQLADVSVTSNAISATLPAQSITLFVLPSSVTNPTVSIPITLDSYTGTSSTVPLSVEIRTAGTTSALDRFTAYLSGGVLKFQTARVGSFDVAIQGPTFLRKVIKSVQFTSTGAALSAITLTNGDSNADNSVGLPDYTMVTKALGATATSSNWNASADLNGDGVVNAADQAIVLANIRKTGDQ